MERALAEKYGWSLREIDETDIESLLPFLFRDSSKAEKRKKMVYIDQQTWL